LEDLQVLPARPPSARLPQMSVQLLQDLQALLPLVQQS